MRLNYYYNFKNNTKFFINIEKIQFLSNKTYDDISWSEPFKFRIRKDLNSFRTLKIPNIYNFLVAYNIYKEELEKLGKSFEKLEELDKHKRMQISYELGEFKVNSYNANQLHDYENLVKFDKLIRIDIKSFYQSLYTHYIFDFSSNRKLDKPLSKMNNGRTAGIIMGNYISLYFAELFSTKISKDLLGSFRTNDIECTFNYFSDDFYIFCYEDDINKIIEIFDSTLEKYDLERNKDKVEIVDYITYTKCDVIEKYWKSITTKCKSQQHSQTISNIERKKNGKEQLQDNNLFFTNQLIYRLEKIPTYKEQKVFIVNFFKSNFFNKIDFSNTFFQQYNYHQICFLIKAFPEICLYIDSIIQSFDAFNSDDFKDLIIIFFEQSLRKSYHDEQLYYFVLLFKLNNFNSLRKNSLCDLVLQSENQLLISYFIKYKIFSEIELCSLKQKNDEKSWFIFYNLILNDSELYSDLENSVKTYLIPKNATKTNLIQNYIDFYIKNLNNKVEILYGLDEVEDEINVYLARKWKLNEEIRGKNELDNVRQLDFDFNDLI